MGPSGATTAEAVTASQKQPSTMQAAAVRPSSATHEAEPSFNLKADVRVNLPIVTEFSREFSADEIKRKYRALCDQHPPSKEFTRYLDNLTLQLHCPPPLLTPEPYPPHPATPPPYPLSAYTVHAPVRVPRPSPPAYHVALSSSTSLRYCLMGKAAGDPRFHYAPPSRPVSRAHSSAAMRSTPEPMPRSSNGNRTAADVGAGGGSRMQVVQKVCAVCRRLHDVQRTATKARYCIQCEKLRWQLRAYGGKVHHLREAYQQVDDAGDTPALLAAAKNFAKLDAGEPMSPAAPQAAAAPLRSSAGRSDSRPGSAAPSSAGVTDGDTEGDVDADGGEQAAAPGLPSSAEEGGQAGAEGGAGAAMPSQGEEALDELAALLAGMPARSGQVRCVPADAWCLGLKGPVCCRSVRTWHGHRTMHAVEWWVSYVCYSGPA